MIMQLSIYNYIAEIEDTIYNFIMQQPSQHYHLVIMTDAFNLSALSHSMHVHALFFIHAISLANSHASLISQISSGIAFLRKTLVSYQVK